MNDSTLRTKDQSIDLKQNKRIDPSPISSEAFSSSSSSAGRLLPRAWQAKPGEISELHNASLRVCVCMCMYICTFLAFVSLCFVATFMD